MTANGCKHLHRNTSTKLLIIRKLGNPSHAAVSRSKLYICDWLQLGAFIGWLGSGMLVEVRGGIYV